MGSSQLPGSNPRIRASLLPSLLVYKGRNRHQEQKRQESDTRHWLTLRYRRSPSWVPRGWEGR